MFKVYEESPRGAKLIDLKSGDLESALDEFHALVLEDYAGLQRDIHAYIFEVISEVAIPMVDWMDEARLRKEEVAQQAWEEAQDKKDRAEYARLKSKYG